MSNWSYGTNILPSERLNESQGTKDVKMSIDAIEKCYAKYSGLQTQAETDPKKAEAAKAELKNVANAIHKAAAVLRQFGNGLTDKNTGKKMGGPLDAATLKKFLSSVDKIIDDKLNAANNPQQGQDQGQQQDQAQQTDPNQVKQMIANTQITPEQAAQIVQILQSK